MNESERQKIRAQVAQVLQELKISNVLPSENQVSYGAYYKAAAVLSTFDDKTLLPMSDITDEDNIETLLADSRIIEDVDGRIRWELLPEVRQEVLQQMGSREALQQALDVNPERPDDMVQKMFEAYIQNNALPIESQNVRELAATLQIVEWLSDVLPDLPNKRSIRQRHEQLSLLQPFYDLAVVRQDIVERILSF